MATVDLQIERARAAVEQAEALPEGLMLRGEKIRAARAVLERAEQATEARERANAARAADAAALAARRALEATQGPAAVELASARAAHAAVAGELAAARAAGRIELDLINLVGREYVLARRVEELEAEARQEREHADARERLETDRRPLLDELDASLTGARERLADAAQAAIAALAAVHGAAAAYQDAYTGARDRMTAAGFVGGRHRFDGSPYASSVDDPLRISGRDWPAVDEQLAACAADLSRVLDAELERHAAEPTRKEATR